MKIYGQVLGVGFRFFIHRKACGDGMVNGWVKNADDHVEALFEGEKELVERCIEACRVGPSFAKVKDVKVSWGEPTGDFSHFEVL